MRQREYVKIWGWNIEIRSREELKKTIKIGKIVKFHGKRVYHFWTRAGLLRWQLDAYGFREAALAHCLDHDVEQFYLYEKEEDVTYAIDYIGIMTHGIRGVDDNFGKTINVSRDNMEKISGRLTLPYVPDKQCRYITADHQRIFDVLDPQSQEEQTLWNVG